MCIRDRSVGETMSIGRSFNESLQKGFSSLEYGLDCLDIPQNIEINKETIFNDLKIQSSQRLLTIGQALRLNTSIKEINSHLKKTDGVMIGRAAYHTPYLLAEIEKEIFKNETIPSRQEVIENLIPYVKDELKKGTRLNQIMRHTLGLFHGQTGASYWKRYLSENMCVRDADVQKIDHIMDKIKYNNVESRVG